MAKYTTKYKIGQRVVVHSIPGIVTGITIRKGNRQYEVGYINNSIPTCCTAEECEVTGIEDACKRSLGFKKV